MAEIYRAERDAARKERDEARRQVAWLDNVCELREGELAVRDKSHKELRAIIGAPEGLGTSIAAKRVMDELSKLREDAGDAGKHAEQLADARKMYSNAREELLGYADLQIRLRNILGADAGFSDSDLLNLLTDRLSGSDGGGPFSAAETALEERIERMEREVKVLLDALHVATGWRS